MLPNIQNDRETMVDAKNTYVLGMIISLFRLSPMDASVTAGQMTKEAMSCSTYLVSGILMMKDKGGGSSSRDPMNRCRSLAKGYALCLQCLPRLSEVFGCCRSCKIPHWSKLDRIRLFMVREGHSDDHFYGQELPSIDELMRDIKERIDASWYSANPDVEQMRIHQRFKAQAHWMMVDLPNSSDDG